MPEVKIREANQVIRQAEQLDYEDEWFELQPVEKKLVGYSLGLGIALLIVFIFIFEVF
ncbi:hypothetical protein [Desulforamulus ferrireducens]|uniref:hypothetical protein n=1 Tax=Desulforamulus ferrireducens TaxID=1833852 RepID=UPI0014746B10|nr:hypothetical protein [Desulforamulus ferrireducens]